MTLIKKLLFYKWTHLNIIQFSTLSGAILSLIFFQSPFLTSESLFKHPMFEMWLVFFLIGPALIFCFDFSFWKAFWELKPYDLSKPFSKVLLLGAGISLTFIILSFSLAILGF